MNITIKEKNGDAQRINVECSPAEWLVMLTALRKLVTSGNANPADIRLARQMVSTNATFVEEGEE